MQVTKVLPFGSNTDNIITDFVMIVGADLSKSEGSILKNAKIYLEQYNAISTDLPNVRIVADNKDNLITLVNIIVPHIESLLTIPAKADSVIEKAEIVDTKHDTVVEKENLVSPHYDAIDVLNTNITVLQTLNTNINPLKNIDTNLAVLQNIHTNIDDLLLLIDSSNVASQSVSAINILKNTIQELYENTLAVAQANVSDLIDDVTPSSTKTFSSEEIENKLANISDETNNKINASMHPIVASIIFGG